MPISVDTVSMKYVLRRCAHQYTRPTGVSPDEVQSAIEGGYLKFHEWPSGHFQLTEKGQRLLWQAEEGAGASDDEGATS